MEHEVLYSPEPWGLPLSERLLPEYLQSVGYATYAVGKWHLGFFKAEHTPSRRGFENHYGVWLGEQDHYTHMSYGPDLGYDFHENLTTVWEAAGKYNTDLFTERAESIISNHDKSRPLFLYVAYTATHVPLQAPQELVDQFQYIPEKRRQIFAAMVTKVDESVGRITQALKKKKMLDNSILIFVSDNGGATAGFNGNVSNFPLKGCKDTLWEGGVRGVGVLWSPLLKGPPMVYQGLINVQDWLPTLFSATGRSDGFDLSQLDGVSQWKALNDQAPPPYQTMLHNIDPARKIAALRKGKWKLIIGRTYGGRYDGYSKQLKGEVTYNYKKIQNSAFGKAVRTTSRPVPDSATIKALRDEATISCSPIPNATPCKPQTAPCLFDIEEDPCEMNNVAASNLEVLADLMKMLKAYRPATLNNLPSDPKGLPHNWNHTWINWGDCKKNK